MTSMTIIDDLLVLLDDQEPRTLEQISQDLPSRSKQTLSSTLGRLVAKGWVKRGTAKLRHHYKITEDGQTKITQHLDQIKYRSERTWDGSWEQVVFNIPERDRKRRDDLRILLVELGYGRLHNSLWLSPWTNREELEEYIHRSKSSNDITIIHTGSLDSETNERIAQYFEWDWVVLDRAYEAFIEEAQAFLDHQEKSTFEARRIVYHYAKILCTDPKLPAELPSKTKRATEAYELYEKVRPFCYEG